MKRLLTLFVLLVISIGSSHAALYDRGGGLIYDDVLNVTWLQDANYAQTSGHDANGLMNWADANAWAASLVYGGYDDWRLPSALNQDGSGPCSGYNCSNSEMGHMFYNNYLSLFTNVQSDMYWSGLEYAPKSIWAWYFRTDLGYQNTTLKSKENYAWAVRSGDVSAVPVPAAVWLFGSGLVCLIGFSKRKKAA